MAAISSFMYHYHRSSKDYPPQEGSGCGGRCASLTGTLTSCVGGYPWNGPRWSLLRAASHAALVHPHVSRSGPARPARISIVHMVVKLYLDVVIADRANQALDKVLLSLKHSWRKASARQLGGNFNEGPYNLHGAFVYSVVLCNWHMSRHLGSINPRQIYQLRKCPT